ncbi:VPS4-associated protein 1 [Microdochium trichocladiopsis]|uniref:VPS4-associated protein 1 n=1 Tax=Microdochium trichocladiopsis TaxID=1682393 RepID=A0A9P9BVW8_9PEZI|nr:VPS4-associated protein 1 [Microdochium trichocladiopsis]KAH7040182.1 VPS4-associated protein 1 [Microdochium trichocladiopsis]
MSFPNIWHHRKVADTASRGCEICYKPTTSVLATPGKQDFFYTCVTHLKDKSLCSPIVDQEALAAKKKKEMDEELEKVKKEYEEKQRLKKEREEAKDKKKDGDKEKDKADDEKSKSSDDKEEKLGDKKAPAGTETPKEEEEPRVFALQKNFHQQRVDRKRQAERAKKLREQMRDPNFFPSVPKDQP